MSKVLLFGGTTEGRAIAKILSENKIECDVCVATEYGEMVMEEMPLVRVKTGRLSPDDMTALVRGGRYDVVIDATHPFAVEVSANIRRGVGAASAKIPLIRFERDTKLSSNPDNDGDKNVIYFDDVASCAASLAQTEGKILLTTGSKELGDFCRSGSLRERLVARVLPGMESVRLCYEAGLTGKQIIAMQGPFSEQMNRAVIEEYGISALVMKESGKTGGADEKVRAAKAAGIPCYVIRRPMENAREMATLQCVSDETCAPGASGAVDGSCVSATRNVREMATLQCVPENASAMRDVREPDPTNYCVVSSFEELCRVLSEHLSVPVERRVSVHVSLAGIGPGGTDFMTAAVRARLAEADCVFGAPRMLEAAHLKPANGICATGVPFGTCATNATTNCAINATTNCAVYPYYLSKDILPVLEELRQKAAELRKASVCENPAYGKSGIIRAVVLFSGDPGFFSGAEKLKATLSALPDTSIEMLPGISSIQYLASKLGRNWQNAVIISMHGVSEQEWLPSMKTAVEAGREIFFLTSGAADIRRLGSFLMSLGQSPSMAKNAPEIAEMAKTVLEYDVHLGYQLSYPDEVVKTLTPEECVEVDGAGLWCGMLIPKKGK